MPLNNTAKLPDIITALQTMQGINGKADLASVIGSPAQDTDTIAMMVGHMQDAKNELATKMGGSAKGTDPLRSLTGGLTIGKKWASGSLATGSRESLYVSGLEFTPSVIVATRVNSSYAGGYYIKSWKNNEWMLADGLRNADIGNGYFSLSNNITYAVEWLWYAFE